MILKILLAGDGGQGIQTIAKLLSQACFEMGFYVSVIPNFGLEQRGGVSLEYLIISDQKIIYPKFTIADIVLIMSEQAELRIKNYKLQTEDKNNIFRLKNYLSILQKNDILQLGYNIFFVGFIGQILADKKLLDINILQKLLENKLFNKINWNNNKRAFMLGLSS